MVTACTEAVCAPELGGHVYACVCMCVRVLMLMQSSLAQTYLCPLFLEHAMLGQ